eukprot:6078039-Pyramimonas_sp.AAC.1
MKRHTPRAASMECVLTSGTHTHRGVIMAAVDVPHEHVDGGVVPPLADAEHLVEGLDAREEAAQSPEGAAPHIGAAHPLVIALPAHLDHAYARPDVHLPYTSYTSNVHRIRKLEAVARRRTRSKNTNQMRGE